MNRFLILLALCPCLVSCNEKQPQRQTDHSFYYWKTTGDNSEDSLVHGINHFYVHYFDVDWSESRHMAVPEGEIQSKFGPFPFDTFAITPVVFITKRTFERLPATGIDTLVSNILNKVADISHDFDERWVNGKLYELEKTSPSNYTWSDSISQVLHASRAAQPKEIQIDCDWSARTRDAYFAFLRKLKARQPAATLSVTIRLYPYRYAGKMGVPPADRGMLMCYNLGQVAEVQTDNSVFSLQTLKEYLKATNYPLPLDYSLPAFGWAVWFRGGRLKGILHHADTSSWKRIYGFRRIDATHYVAGRDEVVAGNYFREGDEIRMEYPDPAELKKAAELLNKEIPSHSRIAFYHWDSDNIKRYEDVIETAFSH